MLLVLTGLGKNARVPKALQEPNGPPRVLWTLTLPPWLEQTLSSCIHAAGRDTLKWHTSRCSLLVSVLPGRCYEGVFTPWSPEEIVLWHFLKRPTDGFSYVIDRAVHVEGATDCQRVGGRDDMQGASLISALRMALGPGSLTGYAAFPGWSRSRPGQLLKADPIREFTRVSDGAWEDFEELMPHTWVPSEIAFLIGQLQWKVLFPPWVGFAPRGLRTTPKPGSRRACSGRLTHGSSHCNWAGRSASTFHRTQRLCALRMLQSWRASCGSTRPLLGGAQRGRSLYCPS